MGSIFSSFTEPAAAMATNEPLIFVIATAAQLPQASTCLEVLEEAQTTGPSTGFALRIFSKGSKHSDLGLLPVDGLLTGEQRRSSDGTQLLCDALVVQIEPQHHWLGVYQGEPEDSSSLRCLDRVALSELSNATCWFYPTHEGTFLSWERGLGLNWPLQSRRFEPLATWRRFRVDCQADTSLVVEDCITVFPTQPLPF
jgi:hypothetical protein